MSTSRGTTLDLGAQRDHHERIDPHVQGRWLSDVILGAQDGVVNTLGVVLGVAGASGSARVTLAAGIAAALAESVSMAAVAYTSSAARGDLFRAEHDRELRHTETAPLVERDEVRRIYAAKGFREPLLGQVVDTICADRDVWVGVMMSEEHRLQAVDNAASRRSALIVGAASFVGAMIPVLPFAIFAKVAALVVAVVLGGAGLYALGAMKAAFTVGSKRRSGLVLAAIGLTSAAAGYAVGLALS
jgi:vacuolar iron transporter family protein